MQHEGGDVLLGIDDPVVVLVYLLCIFSALLCVIYGLVYWNKEGESEAEEISEEMAWETKEDEMDEKELGL
jgi:heme A synthase